MLDPVMIVQHAMGDVCKDQTISTAAFCKVVALLTHVIWHLEHPTLLGGFEVYASAVEVFYNE